MEDYTERDADNLRELMDRVIAVYPQAYMLTRPWKLFPTTYTVFSGGMQNFNMGYGETASEARLRAWDTIEHLMLAKLSNDI